MENWQKIFTGLLGLWSAHRLLNPERYSDSAYTLKFRGNFCPRCQSDKYVSGKNCPCCDYPGRKKFSLTLYI